MSLQENHYSWRRDFPEASARATLPPLQIRSVPATTATGALLATDRRAFLIRPHVFQIVHSAPAEAAMPRVDVATVGVIGSGAAFLFGALALAVGWITGFYFLYPPFAALTCLIASVFYAMSLVLRRQWQGK